MKLNDLVERQTAPQPWSEGDNIPWHDPAFSERMLKEHLSQQHDAASRRFEIVDKHVAWIHDNLLEGRPSKVLDLGCGPGLYANRLARRGHTCVGIDYSPASIRHARETAEQEGLACTYRHEDIRTADYGEGFDLVMLIFGEFNVFSPADAATILDKAAAALAPGGLLLLEPHTFAIVQQMGHAAPTWYTAESGLFSDRPHACLEESCWDAGSKTTTSRYFVVDAATGEVTRYAQSFQAYTDEEYRAVLVRHGFAEVRFFPALGGVSDETHAALLAIAARKAADVGPQSPVSLREVTAETVRTICRLSDTLVEPQKYMVAPNAVSIAQAHFSDEATFRAIYAGETPVGFIMWGRFTEGPDDEPVPPYYFLWRFMIATPYQGCGFGRHAIELLIEYVKSQGASELYVSCGQGKGSPEGFYHSLGFERSGKMYGDEVGLILKFQA